MTSGRWVVVPPEVRFFAHLRQEGDCWVWGLKLTTSGYASFVVHDRVRMYAHRWSYEYLRAEIPEGLSLDHLCRNRACVNPWHLEPVTNRVNILRGTAPTALNAAKTQCRYGHPYDDANTMRIRGGTGRSCRICGHLRYEANKATILMQQKEQRKRNRDVIR